MDMDSEAERTTCEMLFPPEDVQTACPICLEDSSADLALVDVCFHRFCLYCILQWTEFQHRVNGSYTDLPACPVCRSRFASVMVGVDVTSKTYERISVVQEILPHWSQFYKMKTDEPMHKQFRLSLHYRRLVYVQDLQPGVESGATESASAPSGHRLVKKSAVMKKLGAWLQRELSLLLCHEEMVSNFPNSQQQKKEILIVSELIKALVAENVAELRTFWIDKQTGKGIQKMQRELQCFFFDKTEKFIEELAAFICSPYDMYGYDRVVVYRYSRN